MDAAAAVACGDGDVPLIERWRQEQERLAVLVDETDDNAHLDVNGVVRYVGGVDISFMKDSDTCACAALVVLSFPSLEVVYEDCVEIELVHPYISGFLAFREVDFLIERIEYLRIKQPHLMPQVILVDGNGILHVRGFGLACHLGVLIGIPTIGVSKKVTVVDGICAEYMDMHSAVATATMGVGGDANHYYALDGNSGRRWGAAVRTTSESKNPVFVSVGHQVSLPTAVRLVVACSLCRIPEPVRKADLQSRAFIRSLTADTTVRERPQQNNLRI